jgi:hypothetical protein
MLRDACSNRGLLALALDITDEQAGDVQEWAANQSEERRAEETGFPNTLAVVVESLNHVSNA